MSNRPSRLMVECSNKIAFHIVLFCLLNNLTDSDFKNGPNKPAQNRLPIGTTIPHITQKQTRGVAQKRGMKPIVYVSALHITEHNAQRIISSLRANYCDLCLCGEVPSYRRGVVPVPCRTGLKTRHYRDEKQIWRMRRGLCELEISIIFKSAIENSRFRIN